MAHCKPWLLERLSRARPSLRFRKLPTSLHFELIQLLVDILTHWGSQKKNDSKCGRGVNPCSLNLYLVPDPPSFPQPRAPKITRIPLLVFEWATQKTSTMPITRLCLWATGSGSPPKGKNPELEKIGGRNWVLRLVLPGGRVPALPPFFLLWGCQP